MLRKRKGNPLKNAARLKKIVTVFARHGFQDLVERTGLSKVGLVEKIVPVVVNDKRSVPERLTACFEELGPTFVKLGQLLATRPDLTPSAWIEDFKKLHDQVQTLPWPQIEKSLKDHFGKNVSDVFQSFEENPLAAASIAQVHKAVLKTGEKVVVKIQRPGIEPVILEDLSILYTAAELLEKYVPEAKLYNPVAVVDEFAKSLELETNFVIEANNVRRFQDNFKDEPNIKIPEVYSEFSGKRVLVLEELEGIPLSHQNALNQEGIDPESVLKVGLRCYLKMVFTDGLFHGDLHAGNMFVLPNNRIGLIDFGVVGRLNGKTQSSIANMLVALAGEDYDRLAYEYLDLAPYASQVDPDLFARDLRDLIAPYYGLTLRHVNVGRLLMDSAVVAARYRLQLPSELIMFFKSIVTIEGMGRVIMKDFNFLAYSLEFASEIVQSRSEPTKVIREFSTIGRDLNALLAILPRQLKQLIRKLSSADYSSRIEIKDFEAFGNKVQSASDRVFWGLIISSLILGGALLQGLERGPTLLDMPAASVASFGAAIFLIMYSGLRR